VLPVTLDYVIVASLVLIGSVTVHEAAHAWSADLLGDPTAFRSGRVSLAPRVHLDPIGTVVFPLLALFTHHMALGWGKPVPVGVQHLGPDWRRKYVLIAAAGPLSNLLLALLASGLLRLGLAATGTGLDVPMVRLLYTGLSLNVLLAVFNMLPVPPLDGGRVLAGLLPSRAAAMFDRIRPYGFVILGALLLTGVLSTLVEPLAGAIVSRLD
jgi:Zn-dependent protease